MVTSNTLVMVVDDELQMCNVLRRVLEKEGYEVITAQDGETALRFIPEKKPNVILLDMMMPGIDGREVCRRIRELSTKTKIIYVTAKVEQDPTKLKELRSEADAIIAKPATRKQILSTVSRVLIFIGAFSRLAKVGTSV